MSTADLTTAIQAALASLPAGNEGNEAEDAFRRPAASPTSVASAPEDPWTRRARPTFLYVMYAMILWAIPLGLLAAINPRAANSITDAMQAYLAAIPEPLYALFGTGYLGYTVARQWGKAAARGG